MTNEKQSMTKHEPLSSIVKKGEIVCHSYPYMIELVFVTWMDQLSCAFDPHERFGEVTNVILQVSSFKIVDK